MQEEGADGGGPQRGCSLGGGWRLFVPGLCHTPRTPAKEAITLLLQNRFWLRVKKSSCFPAK